MRSLAALLFGIWSLACAQDPPRQEKKPKGKDGAGDAERRKKFLEGESAADAKALVETNNPLHIDAVGAFFAERKKPYKERLLALKALRILKEQDDEEYRRVHRPLTPILSLEACRGVGMAALREEEEEMLLESLAWHADVKYEHARLPLEMYVDPEVSRARAFKWSDRVRETSARLLAAYAPAKYAAETLWSALVERREADGLRQACFDSLKAFHKDLRERVLALTPSAKDVWLTKLQEKLRAGK